MKSEIENCIKLLGSVDSENVTEVEKQLQEALMNSNHLVIDLNGLKTIDVSGIFMLFMFKQKALANCKDITYRLDSSNIITKNILDINVPLIVQKDFLLF